VRGSRIILSAIAAGGLALLAATPALASTVTVNAANRLVIAGEGGERNSIAVSYAAGDRYVIADGAGIKALGTCDQVDARVASCPGAMVAAVTANAGAGADLIALDPATMPASTEGNLNGGTGRDSIFGGGAADAIDGDADHDFLDGRAGGDELRGGAGRDLASYALRSSPVAVTVGAGDGDDGGAEDVTGGGRDTVRGDVEQVVGGLGPDAIVGDGGDDTLFGGDGDDSLDGRGGDDGLLGGTGNDLLLGDNGRDTVRGEDGDDRLRGGDRGDLLAGGPGDDVLKGERGVDAIKGKSGVDRLYARDGTRDARINCGTGSNRREKAKRDKGKRNKRHNDPNPQSC
jgi:Ca2+-binding RTX toxin-like protein